MPEVDQDTLSGQIQAPWWVEQLLKLMRCYDIDVASSASIAASGAHNCLY